MVPRTFRMYTIIRLHHVSGYIHFFGAFFTTISFWVYVSISKSFSISQIPLIKTDTVSVRHFLCYTCFKIIIERINYFLSAIIPICKQTFTYHNRFLVPENSRKILLGIWHQFWYTYDGEKWCHWNYFQIPPALSELLAKWSSQFN